MLVVFAALTFKLARAARFDKFSRLLYVKIGKFGFQEGWRLENENTDDEKSPIIFKGVVYNEMKGMMVSEIEMSRQMDGHFF